MSNKRKVQIGRLDSVGAVVGELGKVYRQARRGDIDVTDLHKSTEWILTDQQHGAEKPTNEWRFWKPENLDHGYSGETHGYSGETVVPIRAPKKCLTVS